MTAEAWPTEDAATKAVDAAARAAYEAGVKARREVFPPSATFPEFDELSANEKVTVKNGVLPWVWAALEALPDPRHGAWVEGLYCSLRHGYEDDNPYPEPSA